MKHRGDYFIAGAVGLIAFALYWRTLAPGVLAGDSGEFQFAAWLGGFAHPTGYPFYLLVGWLWAHLLTGYDPAWRMNLFSALWGAVAVGLVYLLARRSGALPRLAALFATLTFAATPTFWSQAVVAEVYTLNTVFVVAILLALLIWDERPSHRKAYALAVLYGLSLTHHRTMLLLAPAMLVFLWLGYRREAALHHVIMSSRHLITAGVLIFLPLLLYLTIPLTAPRAPYARVLIGPEQTLELYRPTLTGFVRYITGQEFDAAFRSPAGAISRLAPSLRWLVDEMTWAGVALGVIGLGSLTRRARPLLVLTGLSFLTLLIFNLFYGIGDIYVFYIPLYLIWVVWMAFGLTVLIDGFGRLRPWLTQRRKDAKVQRAFLVPVKKQVPELARSETGQSGKLFFDKPSAFSAALREVGGLLKFSYMTPPRYGLALVPIYLLAFSLPIYLVAHNFAAMDQSHNDAARTFWRTVLAKPIPADAILVTNDRDEMMPLWYLQYVEGVRPDLTGVFPLIQPAPAWRDVGAVTDSALDSGRPVLLIKPMPGLDVKFRLEPTAEGRLERVLGRVLDHPPARLTDTVFGGAIRLIGYDLPTAGLISGGSTALTLYWQPVQRLDADYTTFVQLLDAAGAKIAQSDHPAGGVYYPTTLWKPSETLADTHHLTLSADLGHPPYKLLVGLYTGTPDLRHLGEPQTIGIVEP